MRFKTTMSVATVAALLLFAVLVTTARDHGDPRDAAARDRAGALCAAAHDRLAALPPLNDVDGIADAGPRVVALTLDTARRLLALDAGAERSAAIRRYADRLLRQAALTSRLQDAARTGDRGRALDLIAQIADNSRRGRSAGRSVAPGCGGIVRPQARPTPAPAGQAV